jgi:hypothetical protein
MDLVASRLRRGESIAGAGALVLLVSMFALKWYGLATGLGGATSVNGWDSLTHLRWLILVTVACCFALVYLQASRRSPALPVSASVIASVLALLTVLALIYRVLINEPGNDSLVQQKAGAFVGLVSAVTIVYGGYRSMRDEGVADRDAPSSIETVRLGGPGGS